MTKFITKQEDYIQTTCKLSVNDQNTSEVPKEEVKIVGGVAPIRYPLSIHFFFKDNAGKIGSFELAKK